MQLKKTFMMKTYLFKFFIRIIIFLLIFIVYLFNRKELFDLLSIPILFGISIMEILWLIFMIMMFKHLFPKEPFTMALLKYSEDKYDFSGKYSKEELFDFTQKMNYRAWIVMLIWVCGNAVIGLLYAFDIILAQDLFMLTVFYFLCDYICIIIYCPFQSHIMKNKCCVNCRIYDWGHFMMFTPMLFIRHFYSWSLFFMALVVLIRWELVYARHPERFYYGTNTNLQCINCKDETCQIKRQVKKTFIQKILKKK